MYYERLPSYGYEMPCGHMFRSLTPSEAIDDEHYFYCRSCERDFAVLDRDVIEQRPRGVNGKPLGDGQMSRRIDDAIKADRVAAYYRTHWDSVTVLQVSAALGISDWTVKHVAAQLGVYSEPREVAPVRRLTSVDVAKAA